MTKIATPKHTFENLLSLFDDSRVKKQITNVQRTPTATYVDVTYSLEGVAFLSRRVSRSKIDGEYREKYFRIPFSGKTLPLGPPPALPAPPPRAYRHTRLYPIVVDVRA